MVAEVNGRCDEGSGFGVGTGDSKEIRAHDISLSTDGNKTVDVLADGHQDLSGHVSTLLGTRSLVLNMNTSSTTLNEQLGQLHDSGQTTMTGVCISNDGTQVVNVGNLLALVLGCGDALLALFPVMEQLSHPEVVDLVGDSVLVITVSYHSPGTTNFPPMTHHRIVCKVGRGFVGRRSGGGALPARNVNGVEVLGHLGDHGGFETTIGVARDLVLLRSYTLAKLSPLFALEPARTANLEVVLEDTPELFGLDVGRVVDRQGPTLGHNLLSREGTLGVPPSRVLPPGLDIVDLLLVLSILVFKETHCAGGIEEEKSKNEQ